VTVSLHLTPQLPSVPACPADLRRLITLLLQVAAALPETTAPIAVRTERSDSVVRLCVSDGGPPLTEEQADAFFAPFGPARAGQGGLERAACHTIAQRMQADLRAGNRPEGVTAVVEFAVP
jgi:C4-dicarboxylate-specific signal transduction histidine kinase